MKLETELKLAELDKAPAETREAMRRVHATNTRVERGSR